MNEGNPEVYKGTSEDEKAYAELMEIRTKAIDASPEQAEEIIFERIPEFRDVLLQKGYAQAQMNRTALYHLLIGSGITNKDHDSFDLPEGEIEAFIRSL